MAHSSVKLWLESLCLDQYLAILEEAGYDTLDKCASLTDAGLDRVGLTMQGHKRRILAHLPSPNPQMVESFKSVPDDIYDVPPTRSSNILLDQEDIYMNTQEGSSIPALPPKVGGKSHVAEIMDEPKPAAPMATKRPVPAPRATKKPVPRPRASKRSTEHTSEILNESPRSSGNSSPSVTEQGNLEEEYMPMDYVPKRKLSIQLAGATVSETDLDYFAHFADAGQHSNQVCPASCTSSMQDDMAKSSKEENVYSCDPAPSRMSFPQRPTSDVPLPPVPQPPVPVPTAVPLATQPSASTGAPPPPKLPPPLSLDEIEFFENMLDTPPEAVQRSADPPLPSMKPKKASSPIPSSDFDDPLYSGTVFSPPDVKGKDVFNSGDIFDVNAPIPKDLDEWDKQTARKSLMIGTKPPTQTIPLRPERQGSPAGPESGRLSKHDYKPPGKAKDNVSESLHTEIGLELYDTAVDVNKNLFVSDMKKDELGVSEAEEMYANTSARQDSEMDDNELNERLYEESKRRNQAKTDSDPYMAVWDMKSGEDQQKSQESFSIPPPSFAPPPLPCHPQSHMSDEPPAIPGPRPPVCLPSSPKKTPKATDDHSKPPPTPTRPAPQAPMNTSQFEIPPTSSPSARAPVPTPDTVSNVKRAPMPIPDSGSKRPPVPTPDHISNRAPMPLPQPNSPPEHHLGPKPPTRTEASLTPPTAKKDHNKPQLPLRREHSSVPLKMPGQVRESFTDLARVRSSQKTPDNKPRELVVSPPCPPPRTDNPFRPLYDQARGTYSLDDDSPPPSPSMYDDGQSDDTLSNGGDWFDPVGFEKPSIDALKQAVRIVPAVQSRTAGKEGYLLKKSSQDTMRRVGGNWIKRWVTLDAKNLKYFSSKKHDTTKRIIPVASMLNIEQTIRTGESHPCQFQVITVDRIYTFAAETRDELTLWTNMLMLAIIEMKAIEFEEGGEMNTPDKQSYIRMEGIKGRRYFALKKDRLCYYNTMNDYRAGTPITEIEMKLSTVKDLGKHRLQIITPYMDRILLMESDDELTQWKVALEEAIADGLGDDSVLNEVHENHSNRFCADCSVAAPKWASINLGITLCKQCAGIHRMLSFPISKVRSLRMDFRVWKPSLVQMMQVIGNDNANNFWQWHLQNENRLSSTADMNTREKFIIGKYRNKRHCRLHPLNGDQEALNEALAKSVQYSDVLETMQLFHTGANILFKDKNGETCLQLAQAAKQPTQEAFLYQNGAEGSGQMPVTTSMVLDNMIIDGCLSINHKGYLYKTGSNVKGDFLKRWCILERGEFSYYENEKSNSPKDKISRAEILSVKSTSDSRHEFSFELATSKHSRVYLFAAEQEEDRRKWVSLIAKTIAPVPQDIASNIIDFTKAGVVFMKKGANAEWSKCWLQWKKSDLQYYTKGMKEMATVDCRKIKSMSLVASMDLKCIEADEDGPTCIINVQDKEQSVVSLYIQTNIAKETEAWYKVLDKKSKEIGSTIAEQPLTTDNIPVIITKCINFVSLHGMNAQGIYRLNGQHSKVTKLLEDFQKDARQVTLRLEDYQVHDVATVLKRFLRTLGEPVLTTDLYSRWVNNTSIQELGVRLEWYQYLLKELPPVNYCTLKKLLFHLSRVAEQEGENKMGITNIASIFGPIVMKVDKDGDSAGYASTSQEIAVFKDLLDHHRKLLQVKEQDLLHERKMEEAKDKIKHLFSIRKDSSPIANEMLLDIYVISRDREMYQMKVSEALTAERLLEKVLEKSKVSCKNCAIYECICKEELERPLHPQEKVLGVTLRWGQWPEEFRKDNFLCVKENHVYENIDLVFDPHSSLFSELRFSPAEKKGFKFKYCFEFSQMKMSYKKDARATSYLCSWNVEDLTVYVGVQRKRNPPTGWCFTFIKNDDKVVGPFFGHSVCCNSKEELYRWIAAILHGQNPLGFKHGGRSPPDGAACQTEVADGTAYCLEQPVPNHAESVVAGPPIPGRIKGLKSSFMHKFMKR